MILTNKILKYILNDKKNHTTYFTLMTLESCFTTLTGARLCVAVTTVWIRTRNGTVGSIVTKCGTPLDKGNKRRNKYFTICFFLTFIY